MKLDDLRERMLKYEPENEEAAMLYEELEASYQQLLAMSEQLTHTENKYGLLIQNMRDIVWIMDPSGKIHFINSIVSELLGYSAEEMLGHYLYEYMCPLHEYKTGFCKDVVGLMAIKEFERQEMWMLHRDGNTRKVLEVNSKHYFVEDTLVEIQGVGRDITERIQIERRINKKNKHMRFIHDISATINGNLSFDNLDELLDMICKNIVTTVNVPLCTIRLKDDEINLVLKSAYGKYKDVIDKGPLKTTDKFLTSVVENHEPLLLSAEMAESATDEVKHVFEGGKIKNLLVLPLNANDVTVGIMAIGLDSEYDDDYTSLFASLANNLAFAVEKSRLYQHQKTFYMDIIMTLVAAMEAKDAYTQGHSLRVSSYAKAIGESIGLSRSEIEELEIAGILHDIGKIGISDAILSKPGLLTEEEFEEVRKHPTIGMRILENIDLSQNVKDAILYHHLRVDLTGYPSCESVEGLPLFARIIGVADAVDAMTSNRSYKRAMNCKEVHDELMKHCGSQFCKAIVDHTVELLKSKKIIPLHECTEI